MKMFSRVDSQYRTKRDWKDESAHNEWIDKRFAPPSRGELVLELIALVLLLGALLMVPQ